MIAFMLTSLAISLIANAVLAYVLFKPSDSNIQEDEEKKEVLESSISEKEEVLRNENKKKHNSAVDAANAINSAMQ